jgi:GTP-dependent phosphoenolpyruvate carboxykinase
VSNRIAGQFVDAARRRGLTVALGLDGYNRRILTRHSLMTTTNPALRDWVDASAKLTQPDRIHWCTGSDVERDELVKLMLGTGDLIELNQATFPNCYLHRSHPSDVARVEHRPFICT